MSAIRADLAVVLCTYNGRAHVTEQLRSILEQRLLPAEIRVYDDGSTDGTLDEVQRTFIQRPAAAAGVRLCIAPPADRSFGAAANFARAIEDTRLPLVALSDQDDRWLPDRLRATVAVLDADPAAEVVASNALMVDGADRPVGRTVFEAQCLTRQERAALATGDCLPALLRRNLVPGMTFTFRTRFAAELGPLPPGAMHDYWLAAAAAARGSLRLIARPLVRYRIHGGNAVGLDTGRRSIRDRIRIKVHAFRMPLTDLPQWIELPGRLRALGDPAAAERLEGKRAFETRRRHLNRSVVGRVRTLAGLVHGDHYRVYEFQGRRTGLRDAIRRLDPHVPPALQ